MVGSLLLFDPAAQLSILFSCLSFLLVGDGRVVKGLGRGFSFEATAGGLIAACAVREKDVPQVG